MGKPKTRKFNVDMDFSATIYVNGRPKKYHSLDDDTTTFGTTMSPKTWIYAG